METYRGVKGSEFIYHGDYSDPEVKYNNISLSYWDVEEAVENLQDEGDIISTLECMANTEKEYCTEEFKEQYNIAIKCLREDEGYISDCTYSRWEYLVKDIKPKMGVFSKDNIWRMAMDNYK